MSIRTAVALVALLAVACPSADAQNPYAPGQSCVVRARKAPVKKKDEVLIWLDFGTRIAIQDVNGDWVKTTVFAPNLSVNVTGWVHHTDLRTAPVVSDIVAAQPNAEWADLAQILSDPAPPDAGIPRKTRIDVSAERNRLLQRLKELESSSDKRIKDVAALTHQELKTAFATARKLDTNPVALGMLNEDKGTSELDLGFSISATGPSLCANYKKVFVAAPDLDREVAQLRVELGESSDQLQAIRIPLRDHAKLYAGKANRSGGDVLVASVAKLPFADRMELVNVSGVDLTNCLIFVEVVGSDDKALNLHFQPRWLAGQKLTSYYSKGVRHGKSTFARQTFPAIDHVKISVFSEQLSQEDIAFRPVPGDLEESLAEYYGALKVEASYSKGLTLTRGFVHLNLSGVPAVGNGTLTYAFFQENVWNDIMVLKGQGSFKEGFKSFVFQMNQTSSPLLFDAWPRLQRVDLIMDGPVYKDIKPKQIRFAFEFDVDGVKCRPKPYLLDVE